MRTYVIRRLWQSALTLVGVSVLVFVILRVVPGDPAKMLLPEGAPQSAIEELNRQLGLQEPLYVVTERLMATVQLALAAMLITVGVGVTLGIVAAVRRGTGYDYASTVLAVLGQSLP